LLPEAQAQRPRRQVLGRVLARSAAISLRAGDREALLFIDLDGTYGCNSIVKNDIEGIKGDIKDDKESINIITSMPAAEIS
jgi:hypothetical protein